VVEWNMGFEASLCGRVVKNFIRQVICVASLESFLCTLYIYLFEKICFASQMKMVEEGMDHQDPRI
jgi:hypothetical protein